jgi:hypothetical protein
LPASRLVRIALVLVIALAFSWPARGQDSADASEPGGVHVSFGGEVTATLSEKDDGFFNYTDYETSVTRLVSGSISGALQLTDRFALLGELRVQNHDATARGLYLRVRPFLGVPLAVQAGRIPPVFGRFSRRGYGQDNPLIGIPLAYQYLTTLRTTEIPPNTSSLLSVRGRGWLVAYPGGFTGTAPRELTTGIPVVSSMRWDTGVQAHAEAHGLAVTAAVTNGSLSNPRVDDDNHGKQVAGRVTWSVRPWLDLGTSVARGAYIDHRVTDALPAGIASHGTQTAGAADAEISADYWVVRGEVIVSRWRVPALESPWISDALRSVASTLEARYKVSPQLYLAARAETLRFSRLSGATITPLSWDAAVTRAEVGAGYAVTRHVLAKGTFQYNWRDTVTRPQPREAFVSVQVSAWF